MRSGIIAIYNLLHGVNLTPEGFSQALLDGRRLNDVVADTKVLDVAQVLPSAVIYTQERKILEEALVQSGLSGNEASRIMKSVPYAPSVGDAVEILTKVLGKRKEDVQEALIRCFAASGKFEAQFQKFAERIGLPNERVEETRRILVEAVKGLGSELRIVEAFSDVNQGLPIEYVLVQSYRQPFLFPLARLVTDNLELRELQVQKVHTRIAGTAAAFYTSLLKGSYGLSRNLLSFLFEQSQDKRSSITAWSVTGKRKIFYPVHEVSYETLGTLFGRLFFGRGFRSSNNQLSYSLDEKGADDILNVLESFGALESRLRQSTKTISSEQLARAFKSTHDFDESRLHTSQYIDLPYQFTHTIDMVLANMGTLSKNSDFCKAALRGWLYDRSNASRGGLAARFSINRAGYDVKHEDVARKLAQTIGLNISEGFALNNRKIVYVNHPEAVGYSPKL